MPTKSSSKKIVKKTTKKTTVKTTIKNKGKFRAYVCAIGAECFWTRDGRILENLDDLHLAFGSMDEEIFLHHVTKQKNDFADWVELVLRDAECARELRKAHKKTQAEKVLAQHLKFYTR